MRRSLLATTFVALACAVSAHAHGGGTHAGFAAQVSVIEPFIPGLIVEVLGGHRRLSVTNLTEKGIVILDTRGHPVVRVAPGRTAAWAEPRIGANEQPPETDGLVRNWLIRGRADGEPFQIRGFLGYRGPPRESRSSALPAWAIVLLGAGGVLMLGAALAVPLLRRPD